MKKHYDGVHVFDDAERMNAIDKWTSGLIGKVTERGKEIWHVLGWRWRRVDGELVGCVRVCCCVVKGGKSQPVSSKMEGGAKSEKLAKLEKMAAMARTGGKGTVRRKKKAVHKAAPTDDKKVQSTLKKLGLSPIPNCEEAHLFREDGKVMVFRNPKLLGSISANTFSLAGSHDVKEVTDLVSPELLSQLSGGNMQQLQELMAKLQAEGGFAGLKDADGAPAADDEGVPDLVDENFDLSEKPAEAAAAAQ